MKKIEHIGIAVKDLEKSNKVFAILLSTAPYKTETVASEGVKVSFFKVGNVKIELLQSLHEDGPIAQFINRKGEGVHHIAFEVENVDQATAHRVTQGFTAIYSKSKKGADNKHINFLHPRTTNGILVELCQEDK